MKRPLKITPSKYSSSADYVKALRAALGLSQTEFARKAGVNWRTLQNWEIGRARPSYDNMQLLRALEPKGK